MPQWQLSIHIKIVSDFASELGKTNQIRVRLALNFSMFYYEILKETREALALTQKTLDDAKYGLENNYYNDD